MIRAIIFPTQGRRGVRRIRTDPGDHFPGERGYRPGDFGAVEVHRLGIGEGQHEACGDGPSGADGTKDVGPLVAGVALGAGPCATPRPDAGDRALLADACVRRENQSQII